MGVGSFTVLRTACTNLHHISTAKEFFCNLYRNPFETCTEKQLRNGSQPNCKLFWQILTLILPTVTLTSIVQDVYKQVHTVQLQAFTDINKALPLVSKIPWKARKTK